MSISRSFLTVLILAATAGPTVAGEMRGLLAEIDPNRKEIRLQDRVLLRRPGPIFTFDANLQILMGQTPGTLADLMPGQRVRIDYEMRDGKAVARTVTIPGPLGARLTPLLDMVPKPGTEAPQGGISGDMVTGSLARVGLSDRELVVLTGRDGVKTETIIAVPEACKLVKGGKSVGLEAFAVGDVVSVRVEKRDGKLTALSVQDGMAPGAAAPARPDAAARGDLIPKVRFGLKILDLGLQQLEGNK
jgi:hypothetical protein